MTAVRLERDPHHMWLLAQNGDSLAAEGDQRSSLAIRLVKVVVKTQQLLRLRLGLDYLSMHHLPKNLCNQLHNLCILHHLAA